MLSTDTYTQGILQPHKLLQMIVSIDRNTEANGCVTCLRGSHILGRLQHADRGDGQLGADPERVKAAAEFFPRTALELEPGDICFTHSCLVHGSVANRTDDPRWNMVIGYCAKSNEPRVELIADNFATAGMSRPDEQRSIKPLFNRIETVDEGSVVRLGVKHLSRSRPPSHFLSD